MVDSVSVRVKNASVSKNAFKHNRIQWNAGTACVSECVLKTLACRGLRVGPSKLRNMQTPQCVGGGGKTGSICHFAFSLALQWFGCLKMSRCWETQHEKCHCHSPVCVPQMPIKTRI